MQEVAIKAVIFFATLIVALVLDRIVSRPMRRMISATSLPTATIFVNVVRGIIWSLAVLNVLQPVFGVEPTAFVTALGVGSVAISLGLQSSVANVIGGLSVTTHKIIQPGDWVSVSDVTGQVTDITWRHTVVTDILGSQIIVPNSVMSSNQIVRLSNLAARKTTFDVDVMPGADLDAVVKEAQDLVNQSLREAGYAWEGADSLALMNGMTSFGGKMMVVLFVDDPAEVGLARDVATRALGGCSWVARLPHT